MDQNKKNIKEKKKAAHRRGQANKTHRENKSQNIARLSDALCWMSESVGEGQERATHKNQQKSGLERQDTTRHERTEQRTECWLGHVLPQG